MPFCYAVINSSNSTNALKHAQQFRNDVLVVNPKDLVFTFEQAAEFGIKWRRVDLHAVEYKETYEVYKTIPDAHGLVVDESSKEVVSINPIKILEFCKKRTGCKTGVIWAGDKRGKVFGDKKNNKARPLLVLNKIELKKLV